MQLTKITTNKNHKQRKWQTVVCGFYWTHGILEWNRDMEKGLN